MRLVIKGRVKNAKRAAARRGVPVRNCKAFVKNETVCDAPDHARGRVMEWFGERETKRTGRGTAPGALLLFNGGARRRRKRRRR